MNECGRCPERRADPTVLCALMLTDRHCPAALDPKPANINEGFDAALATRLISLQELSIDPALTGLAALVLMAQHLTPEETKQVLNGETPCEVASKAAQRLNLPTTLRVIQDSKQRPKAVAKGIDA